MTTGDRSMPVRCPYCGHEFKTCAPSDLPATDRSPEGPEVICMPYSRDIGRFDPDGRQWFDPKKWSRIGEDFPVPTTRRYAIQWERLGILRLGRDDGHVAVRYRVQACPDCEQLFDVYANYSDMPLGERWAHLFGPGVTGQADIAPYNGVSWTIWIVQQCSSRLKLESAFLSAIMIGLVILGCSLLAWVLPGRPMAGTGASPAWLGAVLTRGVAACGMIAFLTIGERYVRFMQTTDHFYDLLDVRERGGITHWRNFTLCRFVGVQATGNGARTATNHWPRLSQVDVVAGLSSATILAVAWLHHVIYPMALGAAPGASGSASWLWIDRSLELVFWLIFAHVLGVAMWLAMNSAMYVLSGVRKIPMKLDPYRDFSEAQPLLALQNFSITTMLSVFVTVLTLTSVLLALGAGDHWLLEWMRWGLTLIFVGIGLGTRNRHFHVLAILYVAVSSALSDAVLHVPLFGRVLVLNWTVLLLGAFFTLLMVYQVLLADRITSELLSAARDKELARLEGQITDVRTELAELGQPHHAAIDPPTLRQARQHLLVSFESLLKIRDHVANVRISPTLPKRLIQLAGPLVSSFLLPTLWDRLIGIIQP